jgi:catechol 2,3-dioxygenase-like lactoylglutathione lyase family enzyme
MKSNEERQITFSSVWADWEVHRVPRTKESNGRLPKGQLFVNQHFQLTFLCVLLALIATIAIIVGAYVLGATSLALVVLLRPREATSTYSAPNTILTTGAHTMTQTLNALHPSLSGGKESLAKQASTGKQAGRQDTRIGHVGLHATNPAASAEFYRDVFGLEITGGSAADYPLGATAFLTSRPDENTHEIALFANPEVAHTAFKVSSLAELRSFHARVVERKIPVKFVFNFQESFAFFFDDPDGNMIEVYWPTGDLSTGRLT